MPRLIHAVVYRDSNGKKIDVETFDTAFDAKEAAAYRISTTPAIDWKKSSMYVAPYGTSTSDLS